MKTVIVSISNGIASIEHCPKDTRVIIVDFDNYNADPTASCVQIVQQTYSNIHEQTRAVLEKEEIDL